MHTWRVLRSLALRTAVGSKEAPLFDMQGMRGFEEKILTAEYDDEIRLPLAVIARSLTPGVDDAEVKRLPYTCLCVVEWALGRRVYGLATSFANASALVTGAEPYATVAARLAKRSRTGGRGGAGVTAARRPRASAGC